MVTNRPTIWNALLGAEVRYHDVKGVRTRTLEAGSKDNKNVLFLLHGTGGHVEAYTHNMHPLGKDFRVIAVDMIGHGYTDKPDIEYVIPQYTQHLRDLMDVLGVGKASFLGESLGGWVAQYLGWETPERVNKIINCTGGVFRWPEGESEKEAAQRRYMVERSQALKEMTLENVTKRMQLLFHDPDDATPELIETRFRIYSRPEMAAVVVKLHHMLPYASPDRAKYSLTPELLQSMKVPVFYLWGEFNPGSSPESALRAAEMTPGSDVYIMKNVAHWPQWESSEEFNRQVRDYMLK
jgi:pimeloyl-ACP methyl ester carboxylesterase